MSILYIILCGGSLISTIRNFHKINQITHKYAVDYDIVLAILPVAVTGVVFGVNLYLYRLGFDKTYATIIISMLDAHYSFDIPYMQIK
jgi:uncharacterized membrane protein YfcA